MTTEDNNGTCNGPGEVNEPGGSWQPRQPVTFEKVWLMFQETDKKFEETDKEIKETQRIVRELSKNIGGLGNNIGKATEEYFFAALEKLDALAGVQIDYVGRLEKRKKGLQAEYDAVVFGEGTIVVVEIKHRLDEDDVCDFCNNALPAFRELFPEYADRKVLGAVAGLTVEQPALKLASNKGLLVLTPAGQKISVLNPKGFKPKAF